MTGRTRIRPRSGVADPPHRAGDELLLDELAEPRDERRMGADGRIYVIEANANPHLGYGEDFAESALSAGIPYEALLQRILNLGLRYVPAWKA